MKYLNIINLNNLNFNTNFNTSIYDKFKQIHNIIKY